MIKINDTEKEDIKRLYDCNTRAIEKIKNVKNKIIISFKIINSIPKPIYKND